MWVRFNPNPAGKSVGDCAVRAVAVATDQTWTRAYMALCSQGKLEYDMPSADVVWGAYLRSMGFTRHAIPDSCPDCYTVTDFCKDHPQGVYVLGTGKHAVCVIDGAYYDAWDSGNEVPIFYWRDGNGVQ